MDVNLDFIQAKTKHLLFKTNLRAILYGTQVDYGSVLSQYECGVGKWIYGHALAAYGHLPQMHELERVHADIHAHARELVTLYEAGRVADAREGLPAMERIADNLLELLTAVENKINEQSAGGRSNHNKYPATANPDNDEIRQLYAAIHALDERIKTETSTAQAARALAENNENKFRNTVMQAPVGITILRGERAIVEMANEAYLAIVDRDADNFIGKSLYASLPDVEGPVAPILRNILETGEPFYGYEFEVTLNRFGKKQQAFFNFVYHPLREDDGLISGIIVVATDVTGQVKTKKALAEKEAQFRKLVSQSPIAMAIFRGPEHVIELANETLLKNLWRKQLEEVENRKLLEVFPELTNQKFPELMKKVLDEGITYKENEAPAIINSHDGMKTYYLDFEYAPLREMDGSVSGIMVTVNDVTEKVTARRAIERAEKRYRDLVQTLPVAVFTVNKEGYIDMYNEAAVRLWHRAPEIGKDMWHGARNVYTLEGELLAHDRAPLARAMNENKPLHMEVYVEQANGGRRHAIVNPQPIHDTEGNVAGGMNLIIDITDLKETEAALRASEERFRVLANSMPQLIWTAGPDGNLNYFSQSVFDYAGKSQEQVLAEGWLEIVHPDDRAGNITLWTEAVTTGKDFHFEHRFRRADGEYRWQLSRAVPQRDAHGNIQMWVGTSTDIHDRIIFLDELQRQVEERTRALKMSNDHLLRSNGELMQFAYVASHDLQEPLRKIQTFASRIMDTDYDNITGKGKDYFNRLQRSANRTQKLIQDLLAFSRTNTIEKNFEPTDLNEVLAKVKEDVHELTAQQHAVITSGPLPVLPAITYQMEQLFTNLVINAIKFSNPGIAPEITIRAAIEPGSLIDNPHADTAIAYHHISFSDNGIGFDPQFSERIFLVFQRLHTKDAYEGTGIGLSICKRIVENHNGFITATGKPGEGATFDVYVPVG